MVPTRPVLAYKENALVDVDEDGTMSIEKNVYLQVAITGHVVMVVMQFLERA